MWLIWEDQYWKQFSNAFRHIYLCRILLQRKGAIQIAETLFISL